MRLPLFSSVTDKLKIKTVGGKSYLVNLRGIVCSALFHCKYWLEQNETPYRCSWVQPTAEFGPRRL